MGAYSNSIDEGVNVRALTVDKAIESAGGFGKFQCFILALMIISMNSAGMIVYGVAYYEYDPPYICQYDHALTALELPPLHEVSSVYDEGLTSRAFNYPAELVLADNEQACNKTVICDNSWSNLTSWRIDYDNKYYFYNWIEQCDMYCTKSEAIGMLGAFTFLGAALSCFFIPQLADKYGRLPIFTVTMFL
jgi:hypothetical protein